jgi:hypothetical protein
MNRPIGQYWLPMQDRTALWSEMLVTESEIEAILAEATPICLKAEWAAQRTAAHLTLAWVITSCARRLRGEHPGETPSGRREATPEEVFRLFAAHSEFVRQLQSLQEVHLPPPLPRMTESGSTDWTHWLGGHLVDYEEEDLVTPGRPRSSDVRALRLLIGFYDTAMSKPASFYETKERPGPTVCFLERAFAALMLAVADDLQPAARAPNRGSMKRLINYWRNHKEAQGQVQSVFNRFCRVLGEGSDEGGKTEN